MKIYGVTLLAACYILGKLLGNGLGVLIGIPSDIGGVGFGMVLLIASSTILKRRGLFSEISERGIVFWNMMYIPIIVAMSASQNVKKALSGGWIALIIGFGVTLSCFFLLPLLSKLSTKMSGE